MGGLSKPERVSVIRGVPFLKDIPLLGVLFSSKDFEDRAKEILFIITPSISSGGQDYPKMLEDIREKHAKPEYQNFLEEILTDPFGATLFPPQSSESLVPKEIQAQSQREREEAEKAKEAPAPEPSDPETKPSSEEEKSQSK